jgi:hypothetical protein
VATPAIDVGKALKAMELEQQSRRQQHEILTFQTLDEGYEEMKKQGRRVLNVKERVFGYGRFDPKDADGKPLPNLPSLMRPVRVFEFKVMANEQTHRTRVAAFLSDVVAPAAAVTHAEVEALTPAESMSEILTPTIVSEQETPCNPSTSTSTVPPID